MAKHISLPVMLVLTLVIIDRITDELKSLRIVCPVTEIGVDPTFIFGR